jgi:glycosyltransferase involved in cell wall biosynthesis
MGTTKLLVVSGFWPTQANPISGIFASQQIAALCRAGCSVTVLVGEAIGKQKDCYLSPEELGLSADNVVLIKMPLLRLPEVLSASAPAFTLNVRSIGLSVSRAVASLVRERGIPDGCIIHGLRYYMFAAPYWSAPLDLPKIAFMHGVDPFLSKRRMISFAKPYLRRAQTYINRVVLVGSPLRSHAADLGIDEAKTVVIPNGAELPPLSELPTNPASNGGILRVVSVSNLIALKGIEDNIRALWYLKERHGIDRWCYSVIGDGPERARLEALVASLDLKDRIQFLGRLGYAETMGELAKADVFSLPSWGEAFGIVYLEAMGRMRPTIGCLGNGAADIITDGQDGILVPPKDPAVLALALKRLFDQPDLRQALGRRARCTAEQYSWDVNARRVLDILVV